MNSLKYRLYSTSSQSSFHPAMNLLSNTQGWESAYSPSYPQELTIQFYIPVVTKQLALLFHQYKIPSKVQVFTKLGGKAKYRLIGHVCPKDNSENHYLPNQIKTLNMEFPCTHIKFVFFQNYESHLNVFDQVALLDVNVCGRIMNHHELEGVNSVLEEQSDDDTDEQRVNPSGSLSGGPSGGPSDNPSGDPSANLSSIFSVVYSKLEEQKRLAVQRENFQAAANIKSILHSFKDQEEKLRRLEEEKRRALQNQDFDRCQSLKIEIIKRKDQIKNHKEQFLDRGNLTIPSFTHFSQESTETKILQQYNSPVIKRPSYEEMIVPALLNKGKKNEEFLPVQTAQKKNPHEQSFKKDIFLNQLKENGEQPKQNSAEQIPKNQSAVVELMPLEANVRHRLENYFDFIGEKYWRMAHSKSWRHKSQALEYCHSKFEQIATKEQLMGALELVSKVLSTANNSLTILEALFLLKKLCTQISGLNFVLQHLPYFIEAELIQALLGMLNDRNVKIREEAYGCYLHLGNISFIAFPVIVTNLIRFKNKVKIQPKFMIIKLNLMSTLLEKYPKKSESTFKELLNWAALAMSDKDMHVRNEAGEMTKILAFQFGNERATKYLSDHHPHVLNILYGSLSNSKAENKSNRVEASCRRNVSKAPIQDKSDMDLQYSQESQYENTYDYENGSPKIGSPRLLSPRLLSPRDPHQINEQIKAKIREQEDSQRQKIEEEPEDGECEYCFAHISTSIREHFYYECCALAYCPVDKSMIYIREYTFHMLNQCKGKSNYQECPRCKLAFELDEINEHVARGFCRLKRGDKWERCQFCSMDVVSADQEWIKHSLRCTQLPAKARIMDSQAVQSGSQEQDEN